MLYLAATLRIPESIMPIDDESLFNYKQNNLLFLRIRNLILFSNVATVNIIDKSLAELFSAKLYVNIYHCDDPSGVLIPSTTQYSQLYRVKPSYTE